MMRHEKGPGPAQPSFRFALGDLCLWVACRRNAARLAAGSATRLARVGGWPSRVAAYVLASWTGAVIGADLRTVLLRERADALTDSVRAGCQRCLAFVDLLHDLLSPVAGIGAARDGRLTGDAGGTYGEHGDR